MNEVELKVFCSVIGIFSRVFCERVGFQSYF